MQNSTDNSNWLLFIPESALKSPTSSSELIGVRDAEQRVATVLDLGCKSNRNAEPIRDLLDNESTLIISYDSEVIRSSLFMSASVALEDMAPIGPRLDAFRRHLGLPSWLAVTAPSIDETKPEPCLEDDSRRSLCSLVRSLLDSSQTIARLTSTWQNFRLALLPVVERQRNPHAGAQIVLQLVLGVCLMIAGSWCCRSLARACSCEGLVSSGTDDSGCTGTARYFTLQLELALRSALEWLRRYPAGLKLHSGAARLLAQGLAYQLSIWHQWTDTLLLPSVTAHLWRALLLLTVVGGAPCQLALLSDFCQLLSLHLRLLDALCWRLCRLQVRLLAAAARLLSGRKWNPLRLRADSAPYQLDQLLLCTLVFAVLLFLLPTFAAFAAVLLAFHLVWMTADRCLLLLASALCRLPALLLALWLLDHRAAYALPRFEPAHKFPAALRNCPKVQPSLRLRLGKISLRQALLLGPAFYRV